MSAPTPIPTLTQPQREAIFDLLLLGTYADSALKITENERLYEMVSGLGWDSYLDPTKYADTATARVRKATETYAGTREFLADISARLESDDARTFALALLFRLLDSDKDIASSEESFHTTAKAVFGV